MFWTRQGASVTAAEMSVPIPYRADRAKAEEILLACVAENAGSLDRQSEPVRHAIEKRYFVGMDDLTPRVFYRLTDNWLELTVRFIVREHGIREIKDAIARAVLRRFDEASIEIPSTTYTVVGLPPVRVQRVAGA
jgi:small-conductance mechanosensitive channel